MNEKQASKFQFNFPGLLGPCPILKKLSEEIFPWTLEIIQFIRFENHMDGLRYLKKNLGYAIKYLSIWYFISHGCFTAGSVLKFGFVT